MPTTTLPSGARRWITGAALLALIVTTTTGCFGTWGVRESYRSYISSPVAGGEITTDAGATWLDGPGPAKGPFRWSVSSALLDPATETGFIQFSGAVHTSAHPTLEGSIMEASFWNPRLELDGDVGTLVVDLNYRPYAGFAPAELPPLAAALDVDFATVDLSGFDWTLANDVYTITDAPMVGITAAMELIGWDQFYGDPVALDPLSVSFNAAVYTPGLADNPRITVSKTTGLRPGDTVTVWGAGFAPTATTGTRPPLAGQPSGSYVTFGTFAPAWQPSTGAPSSTRTVIAQRWALPQSAWNVLNPAGTNPAYVLVDQYGNFETTLVVGESAAAGDYGIYSYPGSGAVNASYELSVPVGVTP